jgi:hypothetical protein
MIYKIGCLADLETLPLINDVALELLYHHSKILELEYGNGRGKDSDCGYVLYAPPGTNAEELKAFFDVSEHTPEWVNRYDDLCEAIYLITNERIIVIIMSLDNAPSELLNEIDY